MIECEDADDIQAFSYAGEGFRPLVIRPGWQVSQLNDRDDLHGGAIAQVERHANTDEVFVLTRGRAILVVARERAGALEWRVRPMAQGVVYNVQRKAWHTIATFPGVQVMIVEKDHTHLNDVDYRFLSAEERTALQAELKRAVEGGDHA